MNSSQLKIFSILLGLFCLNIRGEFPEDPKPCKYGDTECIKILINYFLKEKAQGDSSINLRKIQPLSVKSVHLQQGEERSVTIDMVLTDNNIYGMETGKAVKVKGFGKDLTKKHSLIINFDFLSIIGDYDVNGKILILPIKGSGKSNITMVNVDLIMSWVGTPVEKDGSTYMKIDKLNLDADPKGMIYKIDNLFNGDQTLGDNMNLFLNENWSDIYADVRLSIGISFSDIYKEVINEVFTKYPYDKFFIE